MVVTSNENLLNSLAICSLTFLRLTLNISIEQEMNQGGYSNENSKDFFKFNRQSKIIRKRHHKI